MGVGLDHLETQAPKPSAQRNAPVYQITYDGAFIGKETAYAHPRQFQLQEAALALGKSKVAGARRFQATETQGQPQRSPDGYEVRLMGLGDLRQLRVLAKGVHKGYFRFAAQSGHGAGAFGGSS
jgi:hypothetical protein